MNVKTKLFIQILVCLAAVALFALGVYQGKMPLIWNKALHTCLIHLGLG